MHCGHKIAKKIENSVIYKYPPYNRYHIDNLILCLPANYVISRRILTLPSSDVFHFR